MKTLICTLLLLIGTTSATYAQTWSIVFGADRTIESGQDEIDKALAMDYTNAILVRRNGWYRSVIKFSSMTEAQTNIHQINQEIRRGSYIVDLDSWCPNSEERNFRGITYFDCN